MLDTHPKLMGRAERHVSICRISVHVWAGASPHGHPPRHICHPVAAPFAPAQTLFDSWIAIYDPRRAAGPCPSRAQARALRRRDRQKFREGEMAAVNRASVAHLPAFAGPDAAAPAADLREAPPPDHPTKPP